MQCAEVKNKLADYSVGLLDERERERIESHLMRCASCAYELRALERVDTLLRHVAPEEPPAYGWQNIRARIESQPQPASTPFRLRRFTLPRLAFGGAIAVALVFAMVYFGAQHSPKDDVLLQVDPTQLMQTHQMMSWGDPLSDKVAIGVLIANRLHHREVP